MKFEYRCFIMHIEVDFIKRSSILNFQNILSILYIKIYLKMPYILFFVAVKVVGIWCCFMLFLI